METQVDEALEQETAVEETLQAAEECDLTDEERALRWVQQTMERRNR